MKNTFEKFENEKIALDSLNKLKGGDGEDVIINPDSDSENPGDSTETGVPPTGSNKTSGRYQGALGHF